MVSLIAFPIFSRSPKIVVQEGLTIGMGFLIPLGNKDRMYWIEREGSGYVPMSNAAMRQFDSGKAHS